jgi:Xaa-Pro aminopeptidase
MKERLFDPERVKAVMTAHDMDVLVACRPENFSYISGITRALEHSFVREHTTYALLFGDAHAALIVPFFEMETVEEETWVEDIAPFRQFADSPIDDNSDKSRGGAPEDELARKVSALGAQRGRIGFDERYTPVVVFEQLKKALPEASFVPATHVFEEIRQVKTPAEIERLTHSAKITERAYEAMWSTLEEGVSERRLAQAAHEVFFREGSPPLSFMNCGAGVRSSIEHLPPSDHTALRGDLIRFDMGVRWRGYHSDIGRTFACGAPSQEQAKIYATIFDAYQNVIQAMEPGATGREVYDVYRRGMGDYYTMFPLEWVAHGVGLEIHEPPYLGPMMDRPLEPGMFFAVEIVLDFPGREGYHVEDPILITETGPKRLIDLSNDSLEVS